MDGIPINILDNVGVIGLAVFAIFAYVKGWVVTPRELRQIEHDRNEWRTESRLKDAQLAEKDKQLTHLEQVGNTVKQLVEGLQREMRKP